MEVDTLYAANDCWALGPTASNEIFAFNLTDVSTWAPIVGHTSASCTLHERQLYLSDLEESCASYTATTTNTDYCYTKDIDTAETRDWPFQ